MNDMTQKLILALVLIPTVFGIFQRPKEMGISVVAIFVALAFANIDKISEFKGAGFEAKMNNVINKAHAAISDLKELGVSLSRPIVDDMALSGQFLHYIPLSAKLERMEQIEASLRKLGAKDDEIADVWGTMMSLLTWNHIYRVLSALRDANSDKKELFKDFENWHAKDWDREKVQNFIKKNELNISDEANEALLDLEHILKFRKLRRPEKWQ